MRERDAGRNKKKKNQLLSSAEFILKGDFYYSFLTNPPPPTAESTKERSQSIGVPLNGGNFAENKECNVQARHLI